MKNPKETRKQPTFFPNWGLPKVPCVRELMLAGTNITSRCLYEIKSVSQLNNVVVPRERTSFTKEGVVDIVRNCPNLRGLSCEEGFYLRY